MATKLLPLELNITCYIVLGIVLIISNTPICFIILRRKHLRPTYSIVAVLLFVGALTGLTSLSKGIGRLIAYLTGRANIKDLTAIYCIRKPFVLLDLLTFPMMPLMLVINNLDRLLVVSFPVTYFLHVNEFVRVQLTAAVFISIVIFLVETIYSIYKNMKGVSTFCRISHYFPPHLYTSILTFHAAMSTLSIVLIIAVFASLRHRRHVKTKSSYSSRFDSFVSKQNHFSRAMIISSVLTFATDTIPSCLMLCAHLMNFDNVDDYVTYTRLVSMANAVNMVIVLLLRQKDLRQHLMRLISHRLNQKAEQMQTTTNIMVRSFLG